MFQLGIFQHIIAVFVFSDRGVKMLAKCLQICAHVFIDLPQNCAQTSFRSCAGLRPNCGHSRSKLCAIICRSCTKLCPNFGSRARLCPISFAPCPFPNLAGTLDFNSQMLRQVQRHRPVDIETAAVPNYVNNIICVTAWLIGV